MARTKKEGDPPNGLKQQIGAGNVLQDPNPNYPPINIRKTTPPSKIEEYEESGEKVPNLVEHAVKIKNDLSLNDFDLPNEISASQGRATPKPMEKMDIKKAQPIDTSGSRPKREVKALPEPPKPKHKLSPKEVITNIKLGINDVRQRNEESRNS